MNERACVDESRIRIRNYQTHLLTTVALRHRQGEKRVRKVKLMPGVEAVRSADVKDELCLSGIDLNAVSISASQVSQMTNIRLKDLRKFLDGIYVTDKGVCVCVRLKVCACSYPQVGLPRKSQGQKLLVKNEPSNTPTSADTCVCARVKTRTPIHPTPPPHTRR